MHSNALLSSAICFWDFQGENKLTSRGQHAFTLSEMNGPIKCSEDGVFGPCSLDITRGQWLRILNEDCPELDLHGRCEVSMVAWIKRQTDNIWQYIAGVWDEDNSARQYALITSGHMQAECEALERSPAEHQPHGYVSDVGGATPGKPFCFSYATGATRIPDNQWTMIGFSYDLHAIRVYTNGRLDENGSCNPFFWDKPLYHAQAVRPAFTVAQRAVPSWPDYPDGSPSHEVGFGGLLGGLAVYDRALDPNEMQTLLATTDLTKKLGSPMVLPYSAP
jgi:hypothetical protein